MILTGFIYCSTQRRGKNVGWMIHLDVLTELFSRTPSLRRTQRVIWDVHSITVKPLATMLPLPDIHLTKTASCELATLVTVNATVLQ